jgi:hypothetical protein
MSNELLIPPVVENDSESREVLRAWITGDSSLIVTLDPSFSDVGAWGILLVDIARHAARAHAKDGGTTEMHLERIRSALEAEWNSPADDGREI